MVSAYNLLDELKTIVHQVMAHNSSYGIFEVRRKEGVRSLRFSHYSVRILSLFIQLDAADTIFDFPT